MSESGIAAAHPDPGGRGRAGGDPLRGDDELGTRLARLARAEGRPRAEIIREAICCYRPGLERDRSFALAGNFERVAPESRPISEGPEDELMSGFGA